MAETGLPKTRVIAELTRSPHGKLEEYLPVSGVAVQQDPEFFAHLIAYNQAKGEVKDARVALPAIGFALSPEGDLRENAAAHLAMLDPRLFLRAMEWATNLKSADVRKVGLKIAQRLVSRYLADKEADRGQWNRVALQHRKSMKRLYSLFHVKPAAFANAILFQNEAPAGTVFHAVRNLGNMTAVEAAGVIIKYNIPFLVAQGALKEKLKSTDVVMALIGQMSATELVTNAKLLAKLGVKEQPALRAALEEALAKAGASTKRRATFKTSVAAAHVGDAALTKKLLALQEKQLERVSIDGDWLVLGDKSGSMQRAIDAACEIAATLARSVKGQVHLVFFDTTPRHVDATGKTLDDLRTAVKHMAAQGNTSIGCGLLWALDKKIKVDGIAVISDGGENQEPLFAPVYQKYAAAFESVPPVYFYMLKGSCRDVFRHNCQQMHVDVQTFDLTAGLDHYALTNLVQTMRASRYGMIEDINAMPLKTLDDVLSKTKGVQVFAHEAKRRAEYVTT